MTDSLIARAVATYKALTSFKHLTHQDNHYVSPPTAVRYTVERWTYEDARDNNFSGEAWTPTLCVACAGMEGDYCVGEWIIDDAYSIDTFHIACAPYHVRWLAVIGTLVCTIRAVLGIDKHHTHTPY